MFADQSYPVHWTPMIAPAVALMALLVQQTPSVERGSGYEFVLLKGWTRQPDDGSKATILVPPNSKGDVRLILYPQEAVENGTYANEAHFHIAMVQALTEKADKKGEPVAGKTGAFQWSRVKFTQQGAEYRLAAYTAKLRLSWGLVAFAAPVNEFETHLPAVEQFIKDLKTEDQGKPAA